MKLSIITVNLNNNDGLELTFNSIKNQSDQDFEYIVIDGSSTDGSLDSIQANSRIDFWISEQDNGVYEAMNKGILAAKGEYLLFLNSGDYLFSNDSIEQLRPHINGEDILYGDLVFSGNGKDVYHKYPSKLSFHFLFTASLGHPASVIKKSLFETYGLYETQYKIIADWVFFIKVIARHYVKTKHIDQFISVFDTHGMSSNLENYQKIEQQRDAFLKEEFSLYYADYKAHLLLEKRLKRIESAKGFKWLRALGVKKFQ